MADERPQEPRPTRGEQVGGILGCLALLLAVALFVWLAVGAGCRPVPPHTG